MILNAIDLNSLKVKIYGDGADLGAFQALAGNPLIKGFTTNPTLMNKAGVTDYEAFARRLIAALPSYPISFEVFADTFDEMAHQASLIAGWGDNVYVKIPITNTKGEPATDLIASLAADRIKVNVTAIMTDRQVDTVAAALNPAVPAIVSVFAGRIADTGVDPMSRMRAYVERLALLPLAELLWASPRELLNVLHAEQSGCDIITATPDILAKLTLVGKDLGTFSLETVKMFYDDAVNAGYRIG